MGRTAAHRRAMLANMACSLIEHKRINTTTAKAKALKKFIEPLITKSRAASNPTTEKGVHNRRIVFSYLRSKEAVTELFGPVSDKVGDRPGGYTRIIKLGNRLGDNADMAMIELVDFNELYTAGEKKKAKSTRRSRRGKGNSAAPEATEGAAVAEVTESAVEQTAAEAEAVETETEAVVEETIPEVEEAVAEAADIEEVADTATEAEAESPVEEETVAEGEDGTASEADTKEGEAGSEEEDDKK